jgi:hypothetical protein
MEPRFLHGGYFSGTLAFAEKLGMVHLSSKRCSEICWKPDVKSCSDILATVQYAPAPDSEAGYHDALAIKDAEYALNCARLNVSATSLKAAGDSEYTIKGQAAELQCDVWNG